MSRHFIFRTGACAPHCPTQTPVQIQKADARRPHYRPPCDATRCLRPSLLASVASATKIRPLETRKTPVACNIPTASKLDRAANDGRDNNRTNPLPKFRQRVHVHVLCTSKFTIPDAEGDRALEKGGQAPRQRQGSSPTKSLNSRASFRASLANSGLREQDTLLLQLPTKRRQTKHDAKPKQVEENSERFVLRPTLGRLGVGALTCLGVP